METNTQEFEMIIERGCGLDIHQSSIVATIRGKGLKEQTRTFDAFTNSLLELKDWLLSERVTHVAMESTGIYWRPVFNVLEEDFELLLVNARHIKNVPGRKTDRKDSSWIAQLLLSGLLKKSFIPPGDIRELRDLFRYRRKLVQQVCSERNRLQKILEDGNIKLSSVVSDTSGLSASRMIDAMVNGEDDPRALLQYKDRRLKATDTALIEALTGKLTKHHRFMLQLHKKSMRSIEEVIAEVDKAIDEQSEKYKLQLAQLQTIPGVGNSTAIGILAEIGADMNAFPTEHHLASWAGMSPGNNESAGKKSLDESQTGINI
jgi:transposase